MDATRSEPHHTVYTRDAVAATPGSTRATALRRSRLSHLEQAGTQEETVRSGAAEVELRWSAQTGSAARSTAWALGTVQDQGLTTH